MEFPYDPEIAHLGICPKDMKTYGTLDSHPFFYYLI